MVNWKSKDDPLILMPLDTHLLLAEHVECVGCPGSLKAIGNAKEV